MTNFLIPIIAAVLSASVTWLLSRPKQKAETDSINLTNAEKAIDINQKMLDLLAGYQNEVIKLREEVKLLTQLNYQLDCEVKSLRKLIKEKQIIPPK
jgi:hypothetical protein